MILSKFYKKEKSKGFTLIEMMLVLSIFAILVGISIGAFSKRKNHILFQETKAAIIRNLEEARSRAATGFNTANHGVRLEGNVLTLFDTVSSKEVKTIIPSSISVNPASFSITFNRLTADTVDAIDIVLSGGSSDNATIRIKPDGTIISQ